MAKIKFVGCGSAFTSPEYYQSNALIVAESGKKMLIDCGSDVRFALQECSLNYKDIDAVYISHLHADHVGGMEWLAFCRFFDPSCDRAQLFCNDCLMEELWEHSLRGGLESLQGKVANLTEYFDCLPIASNGVFEWEGICFVPVQTVHVISGYKIQYGYGLLIQRKPKSELEKLENDRIFFTTDTQFCPYQINEFYRQANIVFHDCETSPFKSNVHAHCDDLKTLPKDEKKKMWLYNKRNGI